MTPPAQTPLRVGLALMPEPAFAAAAAPLFAAHAVDVVEWSFDTCWDPAARPAWLRARLDEFAARGALLGHGVTLSPLSSGDGERQARWLGLCRAECTRLRYARVTEHFGFLAAGEWCDGAPLPPPPGPAAVGAGREALARLADACEAPVGLENLAFAFGTVDVEREGELLDAILGPGDGSLVLDLHNLYCRAVNFDRDPADLLRAYPLHRVHEVHVSGGSWAEAAGRRVRRDTHDGALPSAVLDLLQQALPPCPRVDAVVFEHLGTALGEPDAAQRFRADYAAVRALCLQARSEERHGLTIREHESAPSESPALAEVALAGLDGEGLARLQAAMLDLLADGVVPEELRERLGRVAGDGGTASWLAAFEPRMVATAVDLVRRWGRR